MKEILASILLCSVLNVATGSPVAQGDMQSSGETSPPSESGLLKFQASPSEYPAVTVAEITAQFKTNNLRARQTWMGKKVTLRGYFHEVRPDTMRAYQHILRRDPRYRNVANSGMLLSFGEELPSKRFRIGERPNTFMAYIGLDPDGAGSAFNRDDAVSVSGSVIQIAEGMIILDPVSISAGKPATQPEVTGGLEKEDHVSKLQQPKVKIRTTPKIGVVEKKALSDAMLAAAKANEWESVFEALEEGASANTKNPGTLANVISYLALDKKLSNETRLAYTIKALEYGVSADGGNSRNTPLIQAINRGDYELVLLLLRHDVDPSEPSDLALWSPLKTARKTANQRIIDLLVAAGAKDGR